MAQEARLSDCDRTVQVDTSIEIVAKKLRYRGAQFTARDIFDFAIVAEMEPEGLARLRPLLRQQRAAILGRLDSSEEILRKTFGELDVLDYRRSYDECVGVLRKALKG